MASRIPEDTDMVSMTAGHGDNLPVWEGLILRELLNPAGRDRWVDGGKITDNSEGNRSIEHKAQDMNRRSLLAASVIGLIASPLVAFAAFASEGAVTLIKDPNCGCCEGHASYLEAHGFTVRIEEAADLDAVRVKYGVPQAMAGCHTTLAGDYVVEGHVPAAAIKKLLAERPMIKGISLPGMPEGSPGMGGEKTEPFAIYVIQDGAPRVFMTE
jgi:hypothetical protein